MSHNLSHEMMTELKFFFHISAAFEQIIKLRLEKVLIIFQKAGRAAKNNSICVTIYGKRNMQNKKQAKYVHTEKKFWELVITL